jgi:hypothetical protein
MPRNGLTNLILALLHAVAAPRHRCPILAPVPPPSSSSATPYHCVLERPLSPSPDRLVYRSMDPSDLDASPWCRRGRPCAVHGWGCPNWVTPDQGPLPSSRQGEKAGGEEEDDKSRITVVTGPVGAPVICRTAHISIGPRGRPQGPLVPQTATTPLTLATPPSPPPTLPSPEAGPSGSGTPSDLLSACDNRVLRWFTRFTAPSDKSRAPGS